VPWLVGLLLFAGKGKVNLDNGIRPIEVFMCSVVGGSLAAAACTVCLALPSGSVCV
jgi:hypothetical protein